MTGGPESTASRVGISLVDIATGATAQAAILEALLARARSGEGADIRISMFDVVADWMAVPLLSTEGGRPPARAGLAHPSIAPYGAFRSRDDKEILISIQSEREWKVFCKIVLEQPDLPNDPRYASMVARVANREATDALVAGLFRSLSRTELIARLDAADIAYAEVNTPHDLSTHPHLRRIEVDSPGGRVAMPAPAPIVIGEVRRYNSVPALGADSNAILASMEDTKTPKPDPH